MIKTILIALDGSKMAEEAISVASALAARIRAELVLVTAIAPQDGWTDGPVARDWEQEQQGAAVAYLKSVQRQLGKQGVKVRGVRVEWGRPHVVIGAIADDEGADLIAMTTHGRSGFARWVMGSVADKVLRTSRDPVLLVHSQDEAQTQEAHEVEFKRIIVPLDGSPLAESVLPFVEDLAVNLHASVVLQDVVVPTPELSAAFLPYSTSILNELQAGAKKYVEGVAKRIAKRGVSVETSVGVGQPAETILDAAKRSYADLIALSTHGRSGPARWILGSVADAVIRHADRPCLVIPARGADGSKAEEEHVPSQVPIAGTTVVPPPVLLETPTEDGAPAVRAPEERPHRPERSPGR
jgi:nucleotide-binding universal stress UspA family protein